MRPIVLIGLTLILGVALFCHAGQAQPRHAQPGSILIFPLFDSTPDNNTLITVTNTNDDERVCTPARFRMGDVEAHFTYIDGATCVETDTPEDLTPADTLTVLARSHNPNFEVGYLIVEARDQETGFPIDFDFLIGSAIVVNSEFDFEWSYTPYAFCALGGEVNGDVDTCGRSFTDTPANAADFAQIDFDGMEYDFFPEILLLDNFFGEGTPQGRNFSFADQIYLLSSDPNTDPNDENIALLGWNNNEERFSRTFGVVCWRAASLQELTNAASQGDLDRRSDDSELLNVETGWLQMRPIPDTEALLGVFVQTTLIGGDTFTAGRELQYTGTRLASLRRTF